MRGALAALGDETVRLATGTAGVWLRLLPRLLGLTLLGWVAYHGAVMLGAEVAQLSPWLLIAALSLGLVIRLATVVIALRSVASVLGAHALLRQVAPAAAADDSRDRSLSSLLGVTLLPFLAVYAAFGYVASFARDVVLLSTFRFGPAELLGALNPLDSLLAGITTAAVIVALYVGRRLLDRWQERSGRVLPALLGAFVEASGLFVVLLSGFRLVEGAQLWLGERRLAQWWQQAVSWASGWLKLDLPELISAAWAFFAATIWPVLWDVLSQPLAWLTLAALVFGSRALTLGELWRTPQLGGTRHSETRLQRVRTALAGAGGSRRAILRLQATLLGDIDDKYLPSWQSLRLVLRAGWAFLGAFLLLFNVVRFAGEWSTDAIVNAIGGQPVAAWIKLYPFLDLIPNVLAMSLQLALLGVAFVRILELHAEPRTAAVRIPARNRVAEVVLVGALALAFTATVVLRPDISAAVHTAAVGERGRFFGGQVMADRVQLGTKLLVQPGDAVDQTPLLFVVVRGTAIRPGALAMPVKPTLVNGARSYSVGSWGYSVLSPESGFSLATDFVFEVQPGDVNEGLRLEFASNGFLSYHTDVVSVPLGLTPADAAAAGGRTIQVTLDTDKEVA